MLIKTRTRFPFLLPSITRRVQVPRLPGHDGILEQDTSPGAAGHQDTGH